ncbi:MAG: PEP-CTERM sorting domain-containing protein [Oscillatoriales cyanobacterium RM2_1_1]|nr:PEP-CTERM sorting domain-containing protein [Oscillatoriales cyanobacterium SM2_3_0]NJO45081.1 PEP-CTERM sorting domain-containing protein [Oscillatoriales cyanobacterium RM2_1_1]
MGKSILLVSVGLTTGLTTVCSFGVGIPGNAITISSSARVANSPTTAGDGLKGEFWDVTGSIANLSVATSAIAGRSADATFTSTAVDYPNGSSNVVFDSSSLANLLGQDGNSLSGVTPVSLTGSVFRFSGFINILSSFDSDPGTDTIDVDFTVGSDDGFQLNIGGSTVSEFTGLRPFSTTSGIASFAESGLYALELIYFENQSFTGVEFSSRFSNGIVTTGVLYTSISDPVTAVPEPITLLGSLSALGIGALFKQRLQE